MKKITKLVLMLCLTLSGALCFASGVAEQENEKGRDGIPIELIKNSTDGSSEKGNSIIATINGQVLTVVFTENLGEVAVEITSATGGYVQVDSCLTPNGLMFYIPLAGDYIVTFTLPNGDEYYGEFTVTCTINGGGEGGNRFADKDTPNDSMLYMDVFPNPVSEIVNIEFSDELTEGILEIYNITGIKFDEIQVHDKTVSISMNHLPDGLYFINAKVDGRSVHNAKIIVNKTNKK